MKQLKKIAILILVLTFFHNVLGLYMMVNEQQEQLWVSAIENTVDSKFEIFEIKINPYAYIVDSGFEEVNKDISINKTIYHVFKNRIQNNVLKLYCVKNSHKTALNKNLNKLVEGELLDSKSNKENPIKKILKSVIIDYIPNEIETYRFSKINYETISSLFFSKNNVLDGFFSTHVPPPNVA